MGFSNEWFSDVPYAAINSYLASLGYDGSFGGLQHLTSSDGINFKDMVGTTTNDGVGGGFLAFNIRLRSLVGGQSIYLSPNTNLKSIPFNWKADADFLNSQGVAITAGETIVYYAANATRMSFDDGLGLGKTFVYELPENAYGEFYSETYGNRAQGAVAQLNGAVAYYNRKHKAEDHFDPLTANLAQTNTSFLGADPIAVLPVDNPVDGYYETTVTVRIWLEGWDADCINAALKNQLIATLEFTTTGPSGYREAVLLEDINGEYKPVSVPKEYFAPIGETVAMESVEPAYSNLYELDSAQIVGNVLADNSLMLYQKFNRKTFTISFIPDFEITGDGDLAVAFDDVTSKFGLPVYSPNAPSKEGHSFNWFIDDDYTEPFVFDVMPTEDISLYGKYMVNQYTISFESNGGTALNPLTQDYGSLLVSPSDPIKEHNNFVGWYQDEEFINEFIFETMPAENLVLYAKWEIKQYTISFETNGGSLVDSLTYDYAATIIPPDDPTKVDFLFAGWYQDVDLNFKYTFGIMPSNDFTLYAKWVPLEP